MKKLTALLCVCALLLSACGGEKAPETEAPKETQNQAVLPLETEPPVTEPVIEGEITEIVFDGATVTVDGLTLEEATDKGVYLSRDIVYYEDRDAYESGNPYGEGEDWERHSPEEAAAHTVVNITLPGNYRLSGKLDLGQIRVDLGYDAYDNADAKVNLILAGCDITCTVAPAILFENVYECDGSWTVETAKAQVDTSAAGANLILEKGSENVVHGSHVAKVFKDKEGEKKQVKQDGAIYSYMSMNVAGTGKLDLYADNEGLDTELHLTINGGTLNIRADNDGINTNEDGVSVTTINAGNVHIIAGLGNEGDGIDSNGYLLINGGTVVSAAHPAADAGLDSDLGSYINGGTVVALGSTMDWAESDSDQVTMNLQFASYQESDASILVRKEDGTVVFAYDPGEDEFLGQNVRRYQGAVISSRNFRVGDSYHIFLNADITGEETAGIYDVTAITGISGGVQQSYTGTDVSRFPGGMGGFGGQMPEGMEFPEGMEMPEGGFNGQMPEGGFEGFPGGEPPEGFEGQFPEGFEGNFGGGRGQGGEPPEGFDGKIPEGFEGFDGGMPGGMNFPGSGGNAGGEAQTVFYMQDKVNAFSGVASAE